MCVCVCLIKCNCKYSKHGRHHTTEDVNETKLELLLFNSKPINKLTKIHKSRPSNRPKQRHHTTTYISEISERNALIQCETASNHYVI